MSEMEQWKGTLERIYLPQHLKNWIEQVEFLKEKYHIEVYDWEEKNILFKQSECVFLNGKWYKITKEIYADYSDIFNATKGENGKINFVLKYYNGGCCFDEALEEAIKQMERNFEDDKNENVFETGLCNFISESSESDYDIGYRIAEILINHISISNENLIRGFIDRINEFQAGKYGTYEAK